VRLLCAVAPTRRDIMDAMVDAEVAQREQWERSLRLQSSGGGTSVGASGWSGRKAASACVLQLGDSLNAAPG
jgi:hypothetical protein